RSAARHQEVVHRERARLRSGPACAIGLVCLAVVSGACRTRQSAAEKSPTTVLRVGVSLGIAAMTNPVQGVSQIVQNITTEGLIRVTPSGQTEPQLADTWVLSPDGRALTVTLKPHLKFSDGSPIDAAIGAKTLPALVSDFLGPRLAAGLLAKPIDGNSIELDLPYPSRFWVESLEVPIRKPGASTSIGPFARDPTSATRL